MLIISTFCLEIFLTRCYLAELYCACVCCLCSCLRLSVNPPFFLLVHFHFFSVCKAKVDIGFLVDASGSIEMYGRGNYQRVKDFLKEVAGSFVISRRGTHVGVVVFATRPQPVFQFNTYYTRREVMNAVQKIPYINGGTRIGLAIRRATRYLFKPHPHPGRKKVLVVLTDGISYDDVIVPARRLRRKGVSIYALGMGLKYSRRQLGKIAGTPRHVFTSKFATLRTAARKLVSRICSGK